MKHIIRHFMLMASFVALVGCATPARMGNMTISPTDMAKYNGDTPLFESIFVKSVHGGEDTNPLWTSQIGNNEFRGALENSLLAARLLERVKGTGRYSLEVKLMSIDQPVFGASFTVTTNIRYILREVKSDKVIFEENLLAPYTATMSDALYGVKRLRLANEGSARENINRLISRLYQLNIQAGEIIIKK